MHFEKPHCWWCQWWLICPRGPKPGHTWAEKGYKVAEKCPMFIDQPYITPTKKTREWFEEEKRREGVNG